MLGISVIIKSDLSEEQKHVMLQRLANTTNHAFRVNGQTYYKPR